MSRNLSLLFLIAALLPGCKNQTVEITGILEKARPGEYIFVQRLESNKLITVDSVIVPPEGNFEFKLKIDFPSFYLLKINQNNFLTMLLEPGEKLKMTSHFDSLNYPAFIEGSKGTKLLADYNNTLLKTINKVRLLSEIHDRNLGRPDFAFLIDSLDNLGNGYLNDMNIFTKKYIDDNLPSMATLIILNSQISPGVYVMNPERDLGYFKKVDSVLYKKYPENDLVISLHNWVKDMVANFDSHKMVSAGADGNMEAPDIALPDPEGDTIRLSSTRGSYVLLDFWASWCPPCRAENPNLVRAYTLYHAKGFQIFQVSLDKTRDAWLKGIQDDRLDKWIHVSDLKYWNSAVVPLYRIESIPANYLLDKDGRIIDTNLRGDALQRKLAELFN